MLRPYEPSDLPAITRFIGECFRRDRGKTYHPGDFVHWMSNGYRGEGLGHHFHIAEEAGQILAVVELDADSNSYAPAMDARRRGGAWELELHRACLRIMSGRMRKPDGGAVTVNLVADDLAGKRCTEQLGFKAQNAAHVVAKRSLDVVPDPDLPEGFSIRHVAGEHEAQRVADVHSGAFGSKWDGADYLKVMRTPGFDPERELVVVAPDGRFAAFAVIWLDPVSRSGLFEPVGCHRDFARRGLTKALMFAGMARMKAAGTETAIVGYRVTNEAALGLYDSVGFETYVETVNYVLELKDLS